MKNILKILLFLCLPLKLFGTAQIPDLIIYKGDTLSLYACPLGSYPDKELINPKKLFGSKGNCCTIFTMDLKAFMKDSWNLQYKRVN